MLWGTGSALHAWGEHVEGWCFRTSEGLRRSGIDGKPSRGIGFTTIPLLYRDGPLRW